MAADVSCLALGTDFSAASARIQRSGSKPIGRTTKIPRHRREQQIGLTRQRRNLGLDARGGHQFFECFQPGAALATEGDRVRLARIQTIDQSVTAVRRHRGILGGFTVAAHRHAVVFADRHALNLLIVFPYRGA